MQLTDCLLRTLVRYVMVTHGKKIIDLRYGQAQVLLFLNDNFNDYWTSDRGGFVFTWRLLVHYTQTDLYSPEEANDGKELNLSFEQSRFCPGILLKDLCIADIGYNIQNGL